MEQWYVIQVRSGKEEWVVRCCELLIDDPCLSQSFIPFSKRLRKIRGQWIERKEILFPGYVFMISEDPTRLYQDITGLFGTPLSGARFPYAPRLRWRCAGSTH